MCKRFTLFHGSERIIDKPVYHGGKPYNDYGYGFYCTENETVAKEWSVDEHRDGFCNRYALSSDDLFVLNLNDGSYTILHWLAILLENRRFDVSSALAREGRAYLREHFFVPYEDADVLIGYRADDSYFSFASDFLNGTISVRQLEAAMRLGHLGEQIVLKSQRSFARLAFLGYEPVNADEWFAKKARRDVGARESYRQMEKESYVRGDLYLPMLIDGGVEGDDARLQRIVS